MDWRLFGSLAPGPVGLTLGNFDGVHRGHQALVRQLRSLSPSGCAVVLTFDPHPGAVCEGRGPVALLCSLEARVQYLLECGAQGVIVVPFTREFSLRTGEEFCSEVLSRVPGLGGILVGEGFGFGRGRSGSKATLARWGAPLGVHVHSVVPQEEGGKAISSSRVRECLEGGDVAGARVLLGRGFCLEGTVVVGRRQGQTLGFPTANLVPADPGHGQTLLLPARGVYAAWVRTGGKTFPASVNLGVRPTFGPGSQECLEAHVLGFEGDLYGKPLGVEFVQWLRKERGFSSREELIQQIGQDVARTRQVLQSPRPSPGS